jgi:DNA gyrase subunit A
LKAWRLPVAAPQARGKALINLLPLEKDERITTVMPLPEDEESWATLDVIFATRTGTVRRNKLSDFVEVRQNGKIAMKLKEEDQIVGVQTCSEGDDVLLTSAGGQAIRFSVGDVRVFTGRTSTGVRGIKLEQDDRVISMAILRHVAAEPAERAQYVRQASAIRRAANGEAAAPLEEAVESDGDTDGEITSISPERYAELGGQEQFILTVSQNGYGKRSSAYEYRTSGRGGKGIIGMTVNERNGRLIAAFPVEDDDQIMLVTDGGQLIRVPIDGISTLGRSTQGVIIFDTAEGEHVVSVERVPEDENGQGEEDEDEIPDESEE